MPPSSSRQAGAGRARTGSCAGGGAVTTACRKWPWAGVRAAPAVSSVPAAGDAMEPGAAELYDQALLGILQHVGNVQDFLRVLFGFLYRKTDFYRLLRHPSDRMGFPPGAAQALVLQVARRAGGPGSGSRVGGGKPAAPCLSFPLWPSPAPPPSCRGRAREAAGTPLGAGVSVLREPRTRGALACGREPCGGGGPGSGCESRSQPSPRCALPPPWGRGSSDDAASRCLPTVCASSAAARIGRAPAMCLVGDESLLATCSLLSRR